MKRVVILWLISLLISTVAFAETIQLKSGKTVEGKIIERTDKYIKVDLGIGVPVTYFFDEIEAANDVKPTSPIAANTLQENNERQKVLEFLKKCAAINTNLHNKLAESKKLYHEASSNREKEKAKQVVLDEIKKIREAIKEKEALPTPESCSKLKELAIKVDEDYIAGKELVIKTDSGEVKNFYEQLSFFKQQAETGNEYMAERERLIQEHHISNGELKN